VLAAWGCGEEQAENATGTIHIHFVESILMCDPLRIPEV
jgi:hypothetical protein